MRLLGREQSQDFIAHRRGAALVGVQAENPLAAARLHRAVAQIPEAVERDLHQAGPEPRRNLRGRIGAFGIRHHDLVDP